MVSFGNEVSFVGLRKTRGTIFSEKATYLGGDFRKLAVLF